MSTKVVDIKNRSATSVDRAIGLKIRTARRDANLSQAELGDKLNVSFQQIQKYEKGKNRVSGSRLIELSKALSKPITYFIEEPKYKPDSNGERIAVYAASREGHQLMSAAMVLSPVLQQALVDFAKVLRREAA